MGDDIRHKLLTTNGPRIRRAEVPELGAVYVRSMTELERATAQQSPPTELSARYVIACTCREDGARLFSEADLPGLLAADSRLIQTLVAEILEHCAPFEPNTEATLKNSEPIPAGTAP